MKAKNYVGTKIGKFEILEQHRENKKLYFKAQDIMVFVMTTLNIDGLLL